MTQRLDASAYLDALVLAFCRTPRTRPSRNKAADKLPHPRHDQKTKCIYSVILLRNHCFEL